MRFSQDFIERIQEANNILDLISQHTQLKATGSGWMGRCPFPDHQEKTASFSVSEIKQVYHCFGCHKSGNIFTFLKDFQGLNFPEAVEYLAQRARIPIPEDAKAFAPTDQQKEKRQLILQANQWAQQFFQNELKRTSTDHPVKKYLLKRGLTDALVETFQLGYAPKEWDGLTQYLQSKGVSSAIAEEARLIVARKEGKSGYFDLFRERLMFPIFNQFQNPIAFGGRIVESGEPKYLNSPETPVFIKGRTLYGLTLTAKYIRSQDQCIIVEGYMDLIALYKAGIQNVVATMGTALTPDHCRMIKRMTNNVLVLFDGDEAGKEAAERSLPLLLQADLFVKGLTLPNNLDPDDFINTYGAEILVQEIEKTPDLFLMLLKQWMQNFKGDPAEKIKLIDKIKPMLSVVGDRRLRDLYLTEVAQLLQVSSAWLNNALGATPKKSQVSNTGVVLVQEEKSSQISLKGAPHVEMMLLNLALKSRANFLLTNENKVLEFLTHPGVKAIFQKASEVYGQSPEKFDKLTSLLVSLVDQPGVLFPKESGMGYGLGDFDEEIENKLLHDAIKRVKEHSLKSKLKQMTQDLRQDSSTEKLEQIMNIKNDISSLNKA